MTTMADEQIAEWRRLSEAATPGPWRSTGGKFPKVNGGPVGGVKVASLLFADEDDAAFIAAAREAVPALLDEVECLTKERNEQAALVVHLHEWKEKAMKACRDLSIPAAVPTPPQADDRLAVAECVRRSIDPNGFCGCNVCKAIRTGDLESYTAR